jgi:hypothetical protein
MEERREAFNHITSWAASSLSCALLPLLQDSVTRMKFLPWSTSPLAFLAKKSPLATLVNYSCSYNYKD